MLLKLIILKVSGHTKHLTMFADVDRCRCSAFWCWTMISQMNYDAPLWKSMNYDATIISIQIRVKLDLRFPFDCVAAVASRSKGPRQFQDKRSRVSRQFQDSRSRVSRQFQGKWRKIVSIHEASEHCSHDPIASVRVVLGMVGFLGRHRLNMTSVARAHDQPSAVAPSAVSRQFQSSGVAPSANQPSAVVPSLAFALRWRCAHQSVWMIKAVDLRSGFSFGSSIFKSLCGSSICFAGSIDCFSSITDSCSNCQSARHPSIDKSFHGMKAFSRLSHGAVHRIASLTNLFAFRAQLSTFLNFSVIVWQFILSSFKSCLYACTSCSSERNLFFNFTLPFFVTITLPKRLNIPSENVTPWNTNATFVSLLFLLNWWHHLCYWCSCFLHDDFIASHLAVSTDGTTYMLPVSVSFVLRCSVSVQECRHARHRLDMLYTPRNISKNSWTTQQHTLDDGMALSDRWSTWTTQQHTLDDGMPLSDRWSLIPC